MFSEEKGCAEVELCTPWDEGLWGQIFEPSMLQKYSVQFKTLWAISPAKFPSPSPDDLEVCYR